MVFFLPAALLLVTPQATPTSSAAPGLPPGAPAKREVVRLYMSGTRVLAMLRIGDAVPVPVVFDTGTNGNLLDLKLADRLGLPNTGPSSSIDGSTGKPVPGHDSFLRGARLSGVAVPDARLTAIGYDEPDEVGIFGPNSWPDRLVEMDGPRARLTLRSRDADGSPPGSGLPYLGKDDDALPSATLEFDGLAVPAILDTGNDVAIILPLAYKDKLALDAPPRVVGSAVSAAGSQPILMARLAGSVRIGGVTLVRPPIHFMAGGRPNIGLPVLRRITVVYDHGRSRSWITSTATLEL